MTSLVIVLFIFQADDVTQPWCDVIDSKSHQARRKRAEQRRFRHQNRRRQHLIQKYSHNGGVIQSAPNVKQQPQVYDTAHKEHDRKYSDHSKSVY